MTLQIPPIPPGFHLGGCRWCGAAVWSDNAVRVRLWVREEVEHVYMHDYCKADMDRGGTKEARHSWLGRTFPPTVEGWRDEFLRLRARVLSNSPSVPSGTVATELPASQT